MVLVKAKLLVHSSPYNEEAKDIEFMFNPTELSYTRTARWNYELGTIGSSLLPKANFSGVHPYRLTLNNLLFDTYETRESVMVKYINNIKQGMSARAKAFSRPPVYIFLWGAGNVYFHCVMEKLTYKLTMFLADGTPVQAIVDINLLEVEQENLPSSTLKILNSLYPALDPNHPAGP